MSDDMNLYQEFKQAIQSTCLDGDEIGQNNCQPQPSVVQPTTPLMGERAEDFSYNSFEFPPSPREYDSLDESLRSEQPDHESGNSFQESFVSSLRKNVNMPKFIGRLFMESMQQGVSDVYQGLSKEHCTLMHSLSGLKKWIKQSKKNTFKIKHLRWYFKGGRRETAEELSPEEQGFYYRANRRTARLNRLVMRNILIDSTREQIINNKQVKEKQSYLNASKIYSFRCCNRVLASRMQTN